MSPDTYGALQEAAAKQLAQLIGGDRLPAAEEDIEQLLRCRDGAVDALRQRLRLLGLTTNRGDHADRVRWLRLSDLHEQLPDLLSQITYELPTLPADRRGSPSRRSLPRAATLSSKDGGTPPLRCSRDPTPWRPPATSRGSTTAPPVGG
ncbi:hypothetical protein [Nocardioides zeae]